MGGFVENCTGLFGLCWVGLWRIVCGQVFCGSGAALIAASSCLVVVVPAVDVRLVTTVTLKEHKTEGLVSVHYFSLRLRQHVIYMPNSNQL